MGTNHNFRFFWCVMDDSRNLIERTMKEGNSCVARTIMLARRWSGITLATVRKKENVSFTLDAFDNHFSIEVCDF